MSYTRSYDLPRAMQIFEWGYVAQHIGTALLIYKLHKQKSIYGICIDTQICYLLGLIARCFWIFDTQLASIYFTYIEIFLALVLQLYLLYLCQQYKDILYRETKDIYLRWYSVAGLCLILAAIFHPGKKGKLFFTLQMFVSFTMFVEAAALIP